MTAAEPQVAARATARYLHVSPYKVRQVLELVRGLPVEDAARILQLCEKDAADDVAKVLGSAVANAEHNLALESEELFVARAWADEGPTRKWGQARARGRYFRVRKRTTHLTVILERFDTEELEERRRRDEATGRGAAVAQRRRAERVRRSRRAVAEEPTADEEANADATELVEEVAAEAQETAAVDAPAPETEEDAQAPETEEEEE
jgi:large subunit ribosomal protein L22